MFIYLFIYIIILLLLLAGNHLGCCCSLFLKSTISLECCEGCVSSSFLLKRKKHIFKGLLFSFVVGIFLFFKGRAGGRKFSKPEGEGAGTASRRGELLSPCRMQRLQQRSEEVKFISHKSHVKCLQGEVIKQMYEARGKVHPFQKTLPVSAALQKPREAGRDPTSAAAAFLIVLFLSSPIYLIALSLSEQLAGLPPVRAARCRGCGLGEWRVTHQTAQEAWRDGVMDRGRPAINNQTKSFYWESCGKCGFGNICLHPTNNKWHFSPFLCFSHPTPPPFPPSLSLFWLFLSRFTN